MPILFSIYVFVLAAAVGYSFQFVNVIPFRSNSLRTLATRLQMTDTKNFFGFLKLPQISGSSSKVSSREQAIALKSSIKKLSQGTNNGISASPDVKLKINDCVKQLEKINPTKALTSDSALDGTWRLVYTSNEGSSAGKLGPFVGDVEQKINLNDGIYYNSVTLGPKLVRGTLSATWDVKNTKLWTVKFQDITFELFGIKVLQKSLGGTVGTWRMSYLDEDMRILYAIGGKNTVVENVYILSK